MHEISFCQKSEKDHTKSYHGMFFYGFSKIRRLCKLLVMADKQSQPLSPWRRAPKTVMQKKSYICYISNSVKIEFHHMKSKISEKWCLFVSLSKLIPNPTPCTFFNQICPKLKQGSRRTDSKHFISSQYKFKSVILMLDVDC